MKKKKKKKKKKRNRNDYQYCLVYNAIVYPKDSDGMANIVDPDQNAPLGAV